MNPQVLKVARDLGLSWPLSNHVVKAEVNTQGQRVLQLLFSPNGRGLSRFNRLKKSSMRKAAGFELFYENPKESPHPFLAFVVERPLAVPIT